MISGFIILYLPYHTVLYIQHTDSRIFRTDPDIAFHIFRQFTDTFGIQWISGTSGYELIELQIPVG